MMTASATVRSRPSVRAPFRVLAGLIFLSVIGIAVGMVYTIWKGGVQALRVQDVLMVPGWLWFGRLMVLAALGRTEPAKDPVSRHDHWPFATARLANVYWLIVLCVSVATP